MSSGFDSWKLPEYDTCVALLQRYLKQFPPLALKLPWVALPFSSWDLLDSWRRDLWASHPQLPKCLNTRGMQISAPPPGSFFLYLLFFLPFFPPACSCTIFFAAFEIISGLQGCERLMSSSIFEPVLQLNTRMSDLTSEIVYPFLGSFLWLSCNWQTGRQTAIMELCVHTGLHMFYKSADDIHRCQVASHIHICPSKSWRAWGSQTDMI